MAESNPEKKASTRRKGNVVAFSSADTERSKILGRELPHNIDAEQGVLASIMLDGTNEVINACIALKIRQEYFFRPEHQRIYGAALALFNEGRDIDEITIAEYLSARNQLKEAGGMDGITKIASRIETFTHYRQWADIVREKYFLRTLIKACVRTVEDAYASNGSIDSFIGSVEQKILGISQDRVGDSVRKASEKVDDAVARINKMIMSKGELVGVPTGFRDIDSLLRGLKENEMIVIAGRPGTGKTSIALNIVENALFKMPNGGVPTLIFSLEMLSEQLYQRMIASRARIDQKKLSDGFITNEAINDIQTTANELRSAPLWIDDTSNMTILEMRAKARRLNQQLNGKLGLVVVDYLQLLVGTDPSMPREQQVSEISRGMKAMSKELLAPVIVLAQLNRESDKGDKYRNPRPSDLRESGSIEQDADAILLLSRMRKSDTDDDTVSSSQWQIRAELAKNRNGPTGVPILLFNRNYTRYENFTARDDASL